MGVRNGVRSLQACTLAVVVSWGFAPTLPAHALRAAANETAQPSRAGAITLGYILPDSADERQRAFDLGARLGLAEATHAATLLRIDLIVVELDPSRPDTSLLRMTRAHAASAVALADRERSVLIAPVVSDSLAARLAGWAARPARAIIASEAAPGAVCSLAIFRTGPDDATRAAVARAALGIADDTSRANPSDPSRATVHAVELWHHDLDRFGARQLSDRYMQRYGTAMTSPAWEGWMAVKLAWESALRARDGDVATALARGAFDGHKGVALRFGAGDRVLRQPLIVVSRNTSDAPGATGRRGTSLHNSTLLREIPWTEASGVGAGSPAPAPVCNPPRGQ